MNKLTEWLVNPYIKEDINLPVKVGDTILVGKFKNKKMIVKDIGIDDHGMPTINGRKATTFRLYKDESDHEEVTITEGIYDPGIFKAVFLAGGPGSGKSYVASGIFGIPEKVNISSYGLKVVNQDTELEAYLKKYFGTTDLDNMPDDLFRQLTDPSYSAYSGLRGRTKQISKQKLKIYSKGRLGVIIDGTGHKYKDVKAERQSLIDLGYDTYMVFVNTSLDVAQKRNAERSRKLPSEIVEKYWKDVQKNMAYFQGLFGNANFLLVDNNATLNSKQAQKKFNMLVKKGISKFIKKPIKSKIAKKWIKKQQILKKIGIKEFEVPSPSRKLVKKNKTDKMSGYKKVNEATKIKKVVGIYGGRFQPFGPHHKKVYEWMKKQFDDVYITTSDIKRPPKHPMNFKEKKRHMLKMGIPSNKIVQEKTPYVAKNVLKKFNSEITAVVYAFGAKDAGRLKGGKYFQDYKKNKNNMSGFEENGYIITAPHVSMKAAGMEVSGTAMRQLLGSPKYADDRERRFKKYFGYFDKGVYNMMVNKFKKLFEDFKLNDSIIEEFLIYNNINKIIKEGSSTLTSPTDDGPPTFYRGFSDYKANSKKWIDSLYIDKGWEIIDYMLGKHALNPDFDYTLKYSIVPAVSYDKTEKYKKHIEDVVLRNLGYEIIKWLGLTDTEKDVKGVDVPSPVLPGADGETENTDLKERINLNEEVKLILEVDRMTLEEGVKFNNFLKDWSKKAKQPLDKVRKTMMNKNTFSIAKLNDFSVDKVFKNAKKGYKRASIVFHYLPDKLAKKIQNTKVMKKKDEYLKQADEFLQKHPKTKKVVMMGAAATVTYMWTQMTFVGEPDYDFDLSGVAGAAVGAKNLKDLFGGTEGSKFLTLFVTGKAMGLTMPYPGKTIAKFAVGISYGARKLYKQKKAQKAADVEKKTKTSVPDTVKNPNPKGRKKTVSRQSAVQWVAKTKGTKAAQKYVSSLSEIINLDKEVQLLIEGGAYGHMNHPFDDKKLTFSDLKNIIIMGLGGKLSREDGVTEKLDGQNLMISWVNGKLVTARNKGQLKNFGATAMDIKGVASKFTGRGDIRDAFVFAMKDLNKSIGSLSDKQKEKIFGNGKIWMNLEVMWPKSSNVIDYDKAQIVFHGTLEYDDSGNPIGQPKGSARILAGMIKQVNQHVQKHFQIGKPQFLTVPKVQDFGKKKNVYLNRLKKLQNEYKLKSNDTLAVYHQRFWEEFIFNASKQMKYKIPNKVLVNLTKRWAFFDKSYKIPMMKKDIDNKKFLDWALSFDKNDHSKWVKQNMKPFEVLFFDVGAEILKNISGYLSASPKKAVQKIRKDIINAIRTVKSGGDIKKIETLKHQLDKLNKIGGLKSIVPTEGIVFKYKGNTYKFTGAFAPVNQIVGLLNF